VLRSQAGDRRAARFEHLGGDLVTGLAGPLIARRARHRPDRQPVFESLELRVDRHHLVQRGSAGARHAADHQRPGDRPLAVFRMLLPAHVTRRARDQRADQLLAPVDPAFLPGRDSVHRLDEHPQGGEVVVRAEIAQPAAPRRFGVQRGDLRVDIHRAGHAFSIHRFARRLVQLRTGLHLSPTCHPELSVVFQEDIRKWVTDSRFLMLVSPQPRKPSGQADRRPSIVAALRQVGVGNRE
jgi:hypothetical protein